MPHLFISRPLLALLFLAALGSALAPQAQASPDTIIRLKPGCPLLVSDNADEHLGANFYRIKKARLKTLKSSGCLRAAWPEGKRRIILNAREPLEDLQWSLSVTDEAKTIWPELVDNAGINPEAAWAETRGSAEVKIDILDTGFDLEHPEIAPNLDHESEISSWDFVDDDALAEYDATTTNAAHGTAVASLAAGAATLEGLVGVCPECSLLPMKVLASNETVRDGDLVAAILKASDMARIINASWSFDPQAFVPESIMEAVRYAARDAWGGKGCVLVFAAGNNNEEIAAFVPQAQNDVLVVGASDEKGVRTSYSNFGATLDLLAPGGQKAVGHAGVLVADLPGDAGLNPPWDAIWAEGLITDTSYSAIFSGTSASAPLVAGAAGLLLSHSPELSAAEVSWLLTQSTIKEAGMPDGQHDNYYGHGRLDVGAAMLLLVSGDYCKESPEVCDNNLDDDCDRLIDADDYDCGAPEPRAFELPLGKICISDSECGDGFCTHPSGTQELRFCTALCDFDCPAGGICLGPNGSAICHSLCDNDTACEEGAVCALAEDEWVAPGVESHMACLPECSEDGQCPFGECESGVCYGASDEPEPVTTASEETDGCAAQRRTSLGFWFVVVLIGGAIMLRKTRARHASPVHEQKSE